MIKPEAQWDAVVISSLSDAIQAIGAEGSDRLVHNPLAPERNRADDLLEQRCGTAASRLMDFYFDAAVAAADTGFRLGFALAQVMAAGPIPDSYEALLQQAISHAGLVGFDPEVKLDLDENGEPLP